MEITGSLHSGALGRWFEELCRINVERLGLIVTKSLTQLSAGKIPAAGGVYAFWWTGKASLLSPGKCNRMIELKGPGGKAVRLKIDDGWLGLKTRLPIPLYVGKSATNISKRIGQHLRLSYTRMSKRRRVIRKRRPPTTSCQLRAGIEHMFPHVKDTRDLILENIGLSFVELDGEENAANRFYLEDLAIGLMHPPLNIDIER
jgi:hypothetical protein